jgi:hypothetical protein
MDTLNRMQKHQIIGIDLGNEKITVSKIAHNDLRPVVVADLMDIRNIPNRVMFSKEKDQLRKFGNSSVYNKSWNVSAKDDSLLKKHDLLVGKQMIHGVPGFVVKNMITGHIKDIVDHRFPESEIEGKNEPEHYIVVPSWNKNMSNVMYDVLGAKTMLMHKNTRLNIESISEIDSMILNYVDKNALNLRNEDFVPKKNVLIIDLGHAKTNFVLFSVSKDKKLVHVQQILAITENSISGSGVDDSVVQCMENMALKKYNYNPQTSESNGLKFRAQCIRLKHQLSMNKKIKFTFETPEQDMVFDISRSDIEDGIRMMCMILKKNIDLINEMHGIPDVVELIGGSSRFHVFKNIIEESYPSVQRTMNPDETVSEGAAVYGKLLAENNEKQISYSKIIQNNVDVEYVVDGEKKSLRVFEKFQNTYPLTQDTVVIRIPRLNKFNIVLQDLVIECESESEPESESESKENNKYMDIELMYNMTDLVELVSLKNAVTGNPLSHRLCVRYLPDKYSYSIDVKELIRKFTEPENLIRSLESQNENYQSVINFIEEYYYDDELVNNIIKNINRINGFQGIDNIGQYDEDRKNVKMVSPLKEVCEFYDFCRYYTKTPETQIDQQGHDYIVNVLDNPDGLNGIISAINAIKDIKSKYGSKSS